jgi:hypothetical protein
MRSLLEWYWLPNKGGWVRLAGYGFHLALPSDASLFSERHGYTKPFLVCRGFRLFWLKKTNRVNP